jgi:hypothetical protein
MQKGIRRRGRKKGGDPPPIRILVGAACIAKGYSQLYPL